MTSNSEKMTVAERIALKIKSSPMGELFDEDDLVPIIKDAIKEAFFKPRKNPSSGWNTTDLPPLIVELCQEHMRAEIKEWTTKYVIPLFSDEEFTETIQKYIVYQLPFMWRDSINGAIQKGAMETASQLDQMLRTQLEQHINSIPR